MCKEGEREDYRVGGQSEPHYGSSSRRAYEQVVRQNQHHPLAFPQKNYILESLGLVAGKITVETKPP